MEKEIKEKLRDGKGSVEIANIFKPGEMKGKSRLCAKITINPGSSIGLHEHVNEEEIYYIIKGKGLVVDNDTSYEVGVGDGVLTCGGETHSIENIGTEPLELVAVILLY